MAGQFVFYARPRVDQSGKHDPTFVPDYTPPPRLSLVAEKPKPTSNAGRWTRSQKVVHGLLAEKGWFTMTEVCEGSGYTRKQVADLLWEMKRGGLALTKGHDHRGRFYYLSERSREAICQEITDLSRRITELSSQLRTMDNSHAAV